MQWQGAGKREVEIDWLKKQFQIEEGYERMFDFKKYVIDPAVNDINEHSNLYVSWMQRKTGRRVTHLTFIFGDKEDEKPQGPGKRRKTPGNRERRAPGRIPGRSRDAD